jgi:flagellum-specific peptidoglycan hydrolase FlgJ
MKLKIKKMILIVIALIIVVTGLMIFKSVRSTMRQAEIAKEDQQRIVEAQDKDAQKRHEFAETIAKPAIEVYKQNHTILPSIVIAQAIQESNWGQSQLYLKANNIFGVKGKYKGASIRYYTTEYVSNDTEVPKGTKVERDGDQKKIYIPATFRKYPNVYTAVENHDRVTALNFIKQQNITDYQKQAKLLQSNGYATDPNYSNSLINLIKQYNLSKYDDQALGK